MQHLTSAKSIFCVQCYKPKSFLWHFHLSSSLVSLQNTQSPKKKKKKSINLPVFFPITEVLFTSHFILSVFIFYPLMLCFLLDRTLFVAAECLQRNRQQQQQRLQGHTCRIMYLGGGLWWDKGGRKEVIMEAHVCVQFITFFPRYPAWKGIDLQQCLCQEDSGFIWVFPHTHKFCIFLYYCQACFWRCCGRLRVQIGTYLGLWVWKVLHVWDSWSGYLTSSSAV